MVQTRTLLTSNNTTLGPGCHGVPEIRTKESRNKAVFPKGQRTDVEHKGPGPSDFFADGRFGSTPHDPNTAFSRVPRKTYLDEVPPDNNMSAFYKEKAGAKFKPKFVKGNSFNKTTDRFAAGVNDQNPGPSHYRTTGLEYKTT